MSESPAPDPAPAPPSPGVPGPPAMDAKEIEEGKLFAALSYGLSIIGLPFFIAPLVMRNNDFALYHAKQCLLLWIFALVGYSVGAVLTLVCIGVVVLAAVAVGALVLEILGLIASLNGQAKPMPLIGQFADKWFAGITKVKKQA